MLGRGDDGSEPGARRDLAAHRRLLHNHPQRHDEPQCGHDALLGGDCLAAVACSRASGPYRLGGAWRARRAQPLCKAVLWRNACHRRTLAPLRPGVARAASLSVALGRSRSLRALRNTARDVASRNLGFAALAYAKESADFEDGGLKFIGGQLLAAAGAAVIALFSGLVGRRPWSGAAQPASGNQPLDPKAIPFLASMTLGPILLTAAFAMVSGASNKWGAPDAEPLRPPFGCSRAAPLRQPGPFAHRARGMRAVMCCATQLCAFPAGRAQYRKKAYTGIMAPGQDLRSASSASGRTGLASR